MVFAGKAIFTFPAIFKPMKQECEPFLFENSERG